MIKLKYILDATKRLEEQGANIDEYLLILNTDNPDLFYLINQHDWERNQ